MRSSHMIGRIRRYLDVDSTKKLDHCSCYLQIGLQQCPSLWSPQKDCSPIAKGAKCCCQGYFKDTQSEAMH
jgi:hypothetical protein